MKFKTQNEENTGIKIYKNGENREIKINESKKITNFGNTKINIDEKKRLKLMKTKI